jgi:secreted trypsin-like serine protease
VREILFYLGLNGTVVGWIASNPNLQQLPNFPFIDSSVCRSFFGRIQWRSAHSCAGILLGNSEEEEEIVALDGDYGFISGSPIICPDGMNNNSFVCGILSYAKERPICQTNVNLGYPIVFTDVGKYSDWIQTVLEM